MLVADSISLSFYSLDVLKGCYLDCRPGEVLGMLGRNGSGKSTLLKVIFGSLKPDFGLIRINNKPVKQAYRSRQIAYLAQDSLLPPFLKVNDLLREIDTDGTTLPDLFGERVRDHLVYELSGGQLRLLECLWVLSRPAEYILLDEPFSGVAPVYIEFLQNLIREKASQKGIILTDHIYNPLLAIAGRIVLLHNCSVYRINNEQDLITHQYVNAL